MGELLSKSGEKEKMIIMGLKIGLGIAIGLVLVNVAFWVAVVFIYGLVWVFESIKKLLK
jgi:hypothetical protein